MAETHETIADIIAEMKGEAAQMFPELPIAVLKLATRFEAAHKRERGDCAKMREALAPFPSLCDWLVVNASKLGISDMVAKLRERGANARAALTAMEKEGGANG